jgi:hypothetical protein
VTSLSLARHKGLTDWTLESIGPGIVKSSACHLWRLSVPEFAMLGFVSPWFVLESPWFDCPEPFYPETVCPGFFLFRIYPVYGIFKSIVQGLSDLRCRTVHV